MRQCFNRDEMICMSPQVLFRIPVFFSHQNLISLNQNTQNFFIPDVYGNKKSTSIPKKHCQIQNSIPKLLLRAFAGLFYQVTEQLLSFYSQELPLVKKNPTHHFLQIESSMAYQYGHPLLLVIQRKRVNDTLVPRAGGMWGGGGPLAPFTPIEWFSDTVSVDQFFRSVQWKEVLQNWAGQVRSGYFIQTDPEYKFSCYNTD